MRITGLRFILLVTLVIILTSAMTTSSEYLFLKETTNGIESMDRIELADVHYRDTADTASGVYVSGDYAYVASGFVGLAVIDISDPTNPGTPVYEDTTDNAHGVYVSGDYAYVADGASGLAVIQTSTITASAPPLDHMVMVGGVGIVAVAILVIVFISRQRK